jgi:HlyD family secretion protein
MGEVISVSADLIRDQVTGESYFTARIAMPETELAKLGGNKLQPGIPADIQIKTQDRTALSYLMKPLSDQINKAFRER